MSSPVGDRKEKSSRWGDDAGTTMVDLVVGMTLMSVVLVIFTGAVIALYRAETKAYTVSNSATQLNQAFLALDKTVRYAAAISTPGIASSGDWYVELRATNSGSEVCTQLRIDAQQLQRRTWSVTNAVGSTPSVWQPLASNVTNGGAIAGPSQPFALLTTGVANDTAFQQLRFILTTNIGGTATGQTTSLSSVTFTATNSTLPPPTAPICQQQGRP